MIKSVLLLVFCAPLIVVGQSTLNEVRLAFHEADSEEDLEALIDMEFVHANSDSLNIARAYQAVAQTRMAEYCFSPVSKLSNFYDGRDALEACIAKGKNLETIYLRRTVQLNAPGWLGYNEELATDKAYFEKEHAKSELPDFLLKLMVSTIEQSHE